MSLPIMVLVIEDDLATQQLLTAVLHRQKLTAVCTGDGKTGLELLLQEDYGAIVMDLVLPVLSGLEVLHQLSLTRPELLARIIVITAAHESIWRDSPYIPRTRQVVMKPFDTVALERDILLCCNQV
jgi:DNA-binding response OmpR family regulator